VETLIVLQDWEVGVSGMLLNWNFYSAACQNSNQTTVYNSQWKNEWGVCVCVYEQGDRTAQDWLRRHSTAGSVDISRVHDDTRRPLQTTLSADDSQ